MPTLKKKPKLRSRAAVLPAEPRKVRHFYPATTQTSTLPPLPESGRKGDAFQVRFHPVTRERIERCAAYSTLRGKKDGGGKPRLVTESDVVRHAVDYYFEQCSPAPWDTPEFVRWFRHNRERARSQTRETAPAEN